MSYMLTGSRLLFLSGLNDRFGEGVGSGHKFRDLVVVIKQLIGLLLELLPRFTFIAYL